jgi:hypothetical protein
MTRPGTLGRIPVSEFHTILPTYHTHATVSVRGVTVGTGPGNSINGAKRSAAIQALQYFRARGIPP